MYGFYIYFVFLYIRMITYLSYCIQYNAIAIMMIIIITMIMIIIMIIMITIIIKIIVLLFGIFRFNILILWV